MDFHSLSRKELQALCKKNKIPANQTNLAMAQALSALPLVEGLDEILKPVEADAKQPQEEKEIGTPDVRQYLASKPVDSVSNRRKKPIGHVPKTPAASTTVARACTRRSTRLLDKKLSKMSSVDSKDVVGSMKFDDVSQQPQDLVEAEPNDSKLKSEESFETCNDSIEVSEQLDSNKSIAKEVQGDNEAETENKNCIETMQAAPIEASEDALMDVPVDVSMVVTDNNCGSDSTKKSALFGEVSEVAFIEVTTDHDVAAITVEVPDDASVEGTDQAITRSLSVSSDSGDSVSQKKPVETMQDVPIEASSDSFMDVPDDVFVEVTDNKGGNDSTEESAVFGEASEIASMDVAALTIEVPDDVSVEATDQAFAGSLTMSSDSGVWVSQKEPIDFNTDINTLVDGVVIAEEIGTPKQESSISGETMTVAPVGIPIQSTVADELMGESYSPVQSEPKDVGDEHIQEEDRNKFCIMKENSLQDKSIGQLRKMLKNLTIIDGGKSNCKTNNVANKMDSKRTALQALPENKMTE